MKIIKEFILREVAGEYVLVPTGAMAQQFNGMITLNDTAGFIWENLEKTDSKEEMVAKVLDTYEIDETAATQAVTEFAAGLVNAGLAEYTDKEKNW